MENSHNNYTLIVMLGDKLLDNNLHFKDKEKCKYFANRMNNHPPIPNKEGKLEKMNAYCKSIKISIEIPKIFHRNLIDLRKGFDTEPHGMKRSIFDTNRSISSRSIVCKA